MARKNLRQLRHREKPAPAPMVPKTEEQKQHDLAATNAVVSFAGAFIGALGGSLAASERVPSMPSLPGTDRLDGMPLASAIEDLIDAKVRHDALFSTDNDLISTSNRVREARDALRKEIGALVRRIDEKRSR